ncbi:MAG: helix-turn-helix transcriptional regulator [Bacteriovorax sp.]
MYDYTDKQRIILKQLRKKSNLSQFEVGEALGVTKGYISQIENGSTPIPKATFMFKLLSVYKIKPKYFEELIKNVKDSKTLVKVVRANEIKLDIESNDEDSENLDMELEESYEWMEFNGDKGIYQSAYTLNNYELRKEVCTFFNSKKINYKRLNLINILVFDMYEVHKEIRKFEKTKRLTSQLVVDKKELTENKINLTKLEKQRFLMLPFFSEKAMKQKKFQMWAQGTKKNNNGYRSFLYYLTEILKKRVNKDRRVIGWKLVYKVLRQLQLQSNNGKALRVFRDNYFSINFPLTIENVSYELVAIQNIAQIKSEIKIFKRDYPEYTKSKPNFLNFKSFVNQNKKSRIK